MRVDAHPESIADYESARLARYAREWVVWLADTVAIR
jgi:hypothetical protein